MEVLTRTRICTATVDVRTDEPHPAGISSSERATLVDLQPFVRATIVGTWDSNIAASTSF